MKTTQEQRDELRRMAEAATPGPWEAAYDGAYPTGTVLGGAGIVASCDTDPGIVEQCTNAVYIATANPSTIVALLDDLAAMADRAEKAERERGDQVRVALATFAASLGCAPTSGDIFAAIDTLRARLAEVERERDEACANSARWCENGGAHLQARNNLEDENKDLRAALSAMSDRAKNAESWALDLREAVETAVDFAGVVLGERPKSTIDDERPKDYVSRHLASATEALRHRAAKAERERDELRDLVNCDCDSEMRKALDRSTMARTMDLAETMRLRTRLATLEAAMPTDEEEDAVMALNMVAQNRPLAWSAVLCWKARIDAARAKGDVYTPCCQRCRKHFPITQDLVDALGYANTLYCETCRHLNAEAEIARLRDELAEANRTIENYSAVACEVGKQRDEARRERDERPNVTRADLVGWLRWIASTDTYYMELQRAAFERVEAALRAHAAGSGKGWDDA